MEKENDTRQNEIVITHNSGLRTGSSFGFAREYRDMAG